MRVENLEDLQERATGMTLMLFWRIIVFQASLRWAWALMNELSVRLPLRVALWCDWGNCRSPGDPGWYQRLSAQGRPLKLRHVTQRALKCTILTMAREQADAELKHSQKQLASFAEQLQSTIEQERAAIAREIHDDIGGSLAAIRFDLAWMERHASETSMLAHVQAATDMLQHAVEASQRIMMNLARPSLTKAW